VTRIIDLKNVTATGPWKAVVASIAVALADIASAIRELAAAVEKDRAR
jgi:hypothetical protein